MSHVACITITTLSTPSCRNGIDRKAVCGYNSYNIIMNTKNELAINLIRLRLATRQGCMCEDGDKKLIGLKTKILFLLRDGARLTPMQIMDTLRIAKPNLTMLGNALFKEGLVIREALNDKRNIVYSLTVRGEDYLRTRVERIAECLNLERAGMTEPEAVVCLEAAAKLLDGII